MNSTILPGGISQGTVSYGYPPVDPLTRIATALERIAFELQTYNAKRSATIGVVPRKLRAKAKRPTAKKR